jgi:uncharacterized membrane protein YcaP (DUF421 family)
VDVVLHSAAVYMMLLLVFAVLGKRYGRLLDDRARKLRIDESDVLERARELQGPERLEQVGYAVLERDGQISIVPR